MIREAPKKGEYIDGNCGVTRAEIEYLIKTEMVEFPVDLLARRLRICFQSHQSALKLLPEIMSIFGDIKGWDEEKK